MSSTGSFSIDLSTVEGQPLGCALTDANGNVLGTFVFSDSSASGLGGGALTMDTFSAKGSNNVGQITISGGTIEVSSSALSGIGVTGAVVTAAQAFDPEGLFTLSAPNFTLPAGYSALCTPSAANNYCQSAGPQAGMTLYLSRIDGKVFTADASCVAAVAAGSWHHGDTCTGTTGTQDAFAFTLWNSQADFNACGTSGTPAIGFYNDEAEAFGGIDFSSNSSILTEPLQWATTDGSSNAVTNGWEDAAATAQFSAQDCSNVVLSDGVTNAWKCFDANGNYSLNVGGGCVDASSNPVNVQQQLGMPIGQCSNGTVTIAGISLQTNSCQFSYTPQGGSPETITCSNTFGAFNANGSVYTPVNTTGNLTVSTTTISNIPSSVTVLPGQQVNANIGMDFFFANVVSVGAPSGGHFSIVVDQEAPASATGASLSFNFGPTTFVQSGQLCSSIPTGTNAGQLASYQCYMNYYYQSLNNAQSGCYQKVNSNWGATQASDFVEYSTPANSTTEQVMEKLIYFDDNHAAMTQLQDNYPGIASPGENTMYVPCHTKQKASIKIANLSGHQTLVSGDQLLVSYVQETHLAEDSVNNTVCANAAATGNSQVTGTQRIMFLMTKN